MSRFFSMHTAGLYEFERSNRTHVRNKALPRSAMPSAALVRATLGTLAPAVESAVPEQRPLTASSLRTTPRMSFMYGTANSSYGANELTLRGCTRSCNRGKTPTFTKSNGIETPHGAKSMRREFGVRNLNYTKERSRAMEVHDRSLTSTSHYWGFANT